jgi:uncharacterized protein YutE (UPF0331/DUF86 family)
VSCLLDEGDQFQDYTQAIRNLARDSSFPSALIRQLERLPGFRNVVIHEYVALDMDRVVEALILPTAKAVGRIN